MLKNIQLELKPTEGRRILYDPSNEKGYRYATKEELAKYKPSKKVFKDKKPNVKKAKEEIQNKVIDVLQHAKSPKEFKSRLAAQGVDVRYSEDRENGSAIRGASFRTDKLSVTGGNIGFKWNEISKIMETNLSQAKNKEASMATTVESNKEPLLKEEVISKMKIYLRENPDKIPHAVHLADQSVRIFMEELDPNKNSWLTWRKHSDHEERYNELYQYAENSIKHQREESKTDKLTKPIPTVKEQREIDFVVKLREALQNVTKAINHHVNAGQLNCVKPILEHYGFRETEKGLLFKDLYFSNTIKTTRFEEAQNNILKSFSTHQAEVKEYAELMATKPINISLIWDNLNGNRKEKEASNNLLAKQQKAAVKPVFKMVIAPPLGNFKPKTRFDIRMEEFNKTQVEIAKKTEKIVLAPERSQYKMRR